ncbi:putative hydro-lyase [Pseudomonas sp. LFM046]|uniref:putative hydro-lyase n=1 Tax=Pseudomonas sp. LFM046 TaxID=1608357 RepID=UPI0005CF9E39|nr:putative hydro-lyase [Pseudomonas sp. LFM046]
MSTPDLQQLAQLSPRELRRLIRRGDYSGHTSGLGQRHLQANIVILQKSWADEFLHFCVLNPRSCPLLDVTEPGSPYFEKLGVDVDVRSDVPRYRIHRRGRDFAEVTDIGEFWEADFVAFAIGCSFSFEQALLDAGIRLRHIELRRNVAMYRTAIETHPAGRLAGQTVVSMRPMKAADAVRAIEITARFPMTHGAPVHIGDPSLIGIRDLATPDYGDAVPVAADEIPLFWACGVTPQAVLAEAEPELYITHAPGHMLVSDKLYGEV